MMSAGRNVGVDGVVSLAVIAAAAGLLMPSAVLAQESEITFTRGRGADPAALLPELPPAGSIAPMSLLNYREVRPWARSIREKVRTREMPPWYVDKRIGYQRFLADQSLSDAEIATIVQWVDSGAPRGNPPTCRRRWRSTTSWSGSWGGAGSHREMPEWHTVKPNGPDEKISFPRTS